MVPKFYGPKQLFKQKPIRAEFSYEIKNENFCSSVSKPSNYDSLNAIRRTWGNFARITSLNKFSHLYLKLLFLIDIDETCLISISLEQTLF
ncbi:unnamed protein product [Rotaria sordida]|uniref:Uncharacterized protein n=1 Tax=Rotaria sordida TaxID=392033 RepID=A0A815A069_9BILA|nr:unnamed protein product [Rotaria sordida]